MKSKIFSSRSILVSLCKALSSDKDIGPPVKFMVINKKGGIKNPQDSKYHQSLANLSPEYLEQLHKTINEKQENHQWKATINTIETIDKVLGHLPSTCSAIMASCYSQSELIFNLLTEKAPPSLSTDSSYNDSFSSETISSSSLSSKKNTPPLLYHQRPSMIEITPPTLFRKGLLLETFSQTTSPRFPKTQLRKLLESSFKRPLHSDSFFSRLEEKLETVVVAVRHTADGAKECHGAVIVTREIINTDRSDSMVYLDKFAVNPVSQGLGVADLLWTRLTCMFPCFVWRSRTDNPVNKWYFSLK
jgi:amino-acid N-acetyltransferase